MNEDRPAWVSAARGDGKLGREILLPANDDPGFFRSVEELKISYGEEAGAIMANVQRLLEHRFMSCPWCFHSGPVFSFGDHWEGCPILEFILSPDTDNGGQP